MRPPRDLRGIRRGGGSRPPPTDTSSPSPKTELLELRRWFSVDLCSWYWCQVTFCCKGSKVKDSVASLLKHASGSCFIVSFSGCFARLASVACGACLRFEAPRAQKMRNIQIFAVPSGVCPSPFSPSEPQGSSRTNSGPRETHAWHQCQVAFCHQPFDGFAPYKLQKQTQTGPTEIRRVWRHRQLP